MKNLFDQRQYSLILVDAMNMAFIYYHGQYLSYHGKNTSMLFGVARAVVKLQKMHGDARILFLWEGTNSRRKLQDSDYKKHRQARPNDFSVGVEDVKQFLTAIGVDQVYHIGLEADDMAGYICSEATDNILLITSDADWFQFMKPDQIDLKRGTIETFSDIQATLGFPPSKMGMWKILKGDKSDGIKGIMRFPSSVARLLVNKCESYKEFRDYPIHEHNPIWQRWEDEIKSLWESVIEKNASLVLYNPDWIEESQIITVKGAYNAQALLEIYKLNGFKSLIDSVKLK